jgi:hypothetical protein
MQEERKPFAPVWVIAMSPLAKVFMPQYQKELMANPSKVRETKQSFQIMVDKSSGAFAIPFGKPKIIHDENLYNFITGGKEGLHQRETDWSGIVPLEVSMDVVEATTALITNYVDDPAGAAKEQIRIQKEMKAANESALARAKELSEFRVMRAVRWAHECLVKQYALNKENGLGVYTPSPTEFLCTYVLSEEQAKGTEERKVITDKFQELMGQAGLM